MSPRVSPPIKPGYLNTDKNPWRKVRAEDLLTLLFHLAKGVEREDVGFEDANQVYETLYSKLNKEVWIDTNALESALWSCNLMQEAGDFWHPRGLTFDAWLKRLLSPDFFNKKFNYIQEKEFK